MDINYVDRATGKIEVESPPAEEVLNFLYHNPFGEKAVLPIAKQRFITDWYGKIMDTHSSVSRIKPFVDSLKIDMSESKKSIEEFNSFNEFFHRELKSSVRKIGEGLVSPGDGKMLAFKNVSEVNTFYVKGQKFTLGEFLEDDELAYEYRNASMIILRLSPKEYHRYHFPYSGIPAKSEGITGVYYSVSPIALEENFTKVFSRNKKEICKLSIAHDAEMLIIPVGATMVGSINSTYNPNSEVNKGGEMGYFSFGGSSIVLLFASGRFNLDEDLLTNTEKELETYVEMGETIGTTAD